MKIFRSANKYLLINCVIIISIVGCNSDGVDKKETNPKKSESVSNFTNSINNLETIEGKISVYMSLSPSPSSNSQQGNVRHITLETDDQKLYHLIFLPEARYIENDTEKAFDSNITFHLGNSGRYSCKGERRTYEQYREDREKAGNEEPIRSISGINYFFYVSELEFLKIDKENSEEDESLQEYYKKRDAIIKGWEKRKQSKNTENPWPNKNNC